MISFLSVSPGLFLLLILIRFIQKLWWTPIHIQNVMRSQGIKGPSFKFPHGSAKEVSKMTKESTKGPMDLSHNIFPRILPHIYAWTKLYGKTFLAWHGPQAQLVLTDTELIKEVLNDKDDVFLKIKSEGFVKLLLGDGIFVSEGEKWSKLRKLSNQAFHAENLKAMVPAMIGSVETMLEKWRQHESKEIEVYNDFRIMTADVISRTAFGSSYLEGKNIFEMLTQIGAVIFRNNFRLSIPVIGKLHRSSDEIEADKIEQSLRNSVITIIKKREEQVKRGETDSYGNDFLGLLTEANHEADEKKRITVQNVIDECKTIYLAGQETTNTVLAWGILLLATHTDWQDKARNEVLEIFGHENPNAEGIGRLKIVSMIINETLRLYPPVNTIIRRVESKVRLGKFTLPAGTEVHIPILALHHDPEVWGDDTHLFKPERFAEGVTKATNNNPRAFLPFGFGPRTCVGLNFAANEVKIALSMILRQYKITLSPNYSHCPFQLLTLCPQRGVQVMLHSQ